MSESATTTSESSRHVASEVSSGKTGVSGSAGQRPERNVVLYDDNCPMCTFQVRLFTWLDWFRRVRVIGISKPEARALAPQLDAAQLNAAIHCITPDGRILRGARALRHVGLRMPLFVPLALPLWIPGVLPIAERVYMWVSRNRFVLSRLFRCKEACQILPEREERDEDREARGKGSPNGE